MHGNTKSAPLTDDLRELIRSRLARGEILCDADIDAMRDAPIAYPRCVTCGRIYWPVLSTDEGTPHEGSQSRPRHPRTPLTDRRGTHSRAGTQQVPHEHQDPQSWRLAGDVRYDADQRV